MSKLRELMAEYGGVVGFDKGTVGDYDYLVRVGGVGHRICNKKEYHTFCGQPFEPYTVTYGYAHTYTPSELCPRCVLVSNIGARLAREKEERKKAEIKARADVLLAKHGDADTAYKEAMELVGYCACEDCQKCMKPFYSLEEILAKA